DTPGVPARDHVVLTLPSVGRSSRGAPPPVVSCASDRHLTGPVGADARDARWPAGPSRVNGAATPRERCADTGPPAGDARVNGRAGRSHGRPSRGVRCGTPG